MPKNNPSAYVDQIISLKDRQRKIQDTLSRGDLGIASDTLLGKENVIVKKQLESLEAKASMAVNPKKKNSGKYE